MEYDKLSASLHAALDDLNRGFADVDRVSVDVSRFQMLRARGAFVNVCDVSAEQELVVESPPIRVFVRCEREASLEDLRAEGVDFDVSIGEIRPATVPFSALVGLSEHELVDGVDASTRMRPHLDAALPAARVPDYVQRLGLDGAGVIIGVVDTGIDANHPAFAGRILRTWDQTLDGTGVNEGAYGVEFIGSSAPGSRDVDGHGTHVAGIAAGADATFAGVAPGADLLIVKTDFDAGRIASAVRYIFRVADELGQPAVVNLSLGSHNDPHDGTDAFSQAIDGQVGPGRIVCASAGNEGESAMHAEVHLDLSTPSTSIDVSVDPTGPSRAWLNVWYDVNDEIEVRVTSPGMNATSWQGPMPGPAAHTFSLPDGEVQTSTPLPSASDPGHNIVIELRPLADLGNVAPGLWQVELNGSTIADGGVHAWVMDAPDGQVPTSFTSHDVDSHKVGAPAAADGALAIGATVSKNSWTDSGQQSWSSGMTVGDCAGFSSPGPRRDGGQKPDVCAPGTMIVSARSSHHAAEPFSVIDAEHLAMQGTSMSCPFVTGLVALLLANDPTLDAAGVKSALVSAAAIPGSPAGAWDPKWGFGAVDADSL